jgi:hypothetical protein
MASLTGQSINTTYEGLIKTDLNTALPTGFTSATITDGAGNATGLKLGQNYIGIEPTSGHLYDVASQNGFSFDGTQLTASGLWDFSTATITGIDTGVTSIIAGTNITIDQSTGDVTISASGGGGGAFETVSNNAMAFGVNGTQSSPTGNTFYSLCGIQPISMGSQLVPSGFINYYPANFIAGDVIDEWAIRVTGASTTTGDLEIGIYNVQQDTNGNWRPYQLVQSLGSVDTTSVGIKTVTSVGWTVPATGVYFVAAFYIGSSSVNTLGTTNTQCAVSSYDFTQTSASGKLGNIQQSGQTSLPSDLSTVNLQGNNAVVATLVGFKKS